jgi:hypothetical protein
MLLGNCIEENSCLKAKVPKLKEVLDLLKQEASSLKNSQEVQLSQPQSEEISPTPPKKKKQSAIFKLVTTAMLAKDLEKKECSEIDMYMNMNLLEETDSPLLFWKSKENQLLILSNLAKQLLGMPASSGSVERLFSVAGAIARSRRSRITVEKLEQLLCYQQFLLNSK